MKCLFRRMPIVCMALGLGLAVLAAERVTPSAGTSENPQIIARIHSAGLGALNSESGGTVFKEIWNLPPTTRLRDESLDKIAAAVTRHFQAKKDGSPKGNPVAFMRPFLTDLSSAEMFAEVIEHPPGRLEINIAVQAGSDRANDLQNKWDQVVADWDFTNGRVACLATNGWVAMQWLWGDSTNFGNENSLFRTLQHGGKPTTSASDHWLLIHADLARWSEWLNFLRGRDLPKVDLTVSGRKEYLRTQARFTFRDAIAPRIEKWQIPIETIRDPLISFTSFQGLAGLLEKSAFVKELGLSPIPDQLFLWGLSQTSFQIQGAVPVSDGTNAFEKITEKWVPQFNMVLSNYAVGNIRPVKDRPELVWRNLPIIVPYLQPAQDHGQGYLHAGIFPVDPSKKPPPGELFEQLASQTNLVYYDWEITQARLDQLRPLLQLAAVIVTISPMSTNSTAYKWLDVVEPRLGNSITEVAIQSPRELSLTRNSHLGFNGLELLTLANWLDGTNFPRMNLDIGFRSVVRSANQNSSR